MKLERKRLSLSDGELTYVEEGEGPAVVLLHGFPTSSHLWRDLVPMLAPRFRAIAPDLLGYGDSGKVPEADLGHQAHTRRTRELLERLGVDEFAVVGHDIGGGVAQRLALEGSCRALVLIDSIPIDEEPIEAVRMIAEMEPDRADEDFVANLVEVTLDLGTSTDDRLSPEDLEEYVRPWRAEPPAIVRAARGIQRAPGSLEDLRGLDIPALLLWGEDDPYLPPEIGEQLSDVLDRSTLAVLPGCSHFLTEDAAETVLPIVADWLRSQYLGEGHGHAGPQPIELGGARGGGSPEPPGPSDRPATAPPTDGASFERPERPDTPEGFEDLED